MRFLHSMLLWSCAAAALSGCGNPDAPAPEEKNAARPVVSAQDDAVILDVRSADEYASGHLRDACNIPHDRIAEEIAAVAPDKTVQIILYCRSGRRAATALNALHGLGYENVSNFGGLEDAQERLGLPVVK